MRHQSHHIAVAVDDSGDTRDRAVGALALVAEDDPPRCLELGEQLRIGEEAPLAVLDRDAEMLSLRAPSCKRRIGPRDGERHVAADKTEGAVRSQRARQQTCLAEDLEAVADPEYEATFSCQCS